MVCSSHLYECTIHNNKFGNGVSAYYSDNLIILFGFGNEVSLSHLLYVC